jgi:hypothetical protein
VVGVIGLEWKGLSGRLSRDEQDRDRTACATLNGIYHPMILIASMGPFLRL